MKHALALLLLSCVLVAQDKPKPAAEAPKPTAVEPDFNKIAEDLFAAEAAEKMRKQKLLQTPINVRDELIELINQLKEDASALITPPSDPDGFGGTNGRIRADIYIAKMKAKADAQNTLLQALLELAKLPVDSPKQFHSSSVRRDLQRK
jgi:hypothetical protein